MVPADTDTEAQPPPGQQIDIGRLPGHECRLALRQDQDAGGEPDSFSDAGEIGEHHERIVERVVLGVRAGQLTFDRHEPHRAHGRRRADGRSPGPRRLYRSADSDRIASKLGLGVNNADLHETAAFHRLFHDPKGQADIRRDGPERQKWDGLTSFVLTDFGGD